ncbi:hypothetical protein ABLE91_26035 [Aquabacter sp. CN5-332]|uniref:hypothetical protein n=1 Tax=Aquabacter sp. CN5-332 TaxID=3156608 RepID=UPI0032B4E800
MSGSLLRRLLAILVVVGLTAGPFAASAAVGPMEPSAAMTDEAMAGDMPCCPDEKPVLPDCQKLCPLMMSCLTKCFQPGPSASAWDRLALRLTDIIALRDDALPSGLAAEPPPRPPRT